MQRNNRDMIIQSSTYSSFESLSSVEPRQRISNIYIYLYVSDQSVFIGSEGSRKSVCLCLPSTGDIDTLGAQYLSVNKDSHQLLQGGFVFYKGWSACILLFFVRGISSLDHEARQIHWM